MVIRIVLSQTDKIKHQLRRRSVLQDRDKHSSHVLAVFLQFSTPGLQEPPVFRDTGHVQLSQVLQGKVRRRHVQGEWTVE